MRVGSAIPPIPTRISGSKIRTPLIFIGGLRLIWVTTIVLHNVRLAGTTNDAILDSRMGMLRPPKSVSWACNIFLAAQPAQRVAQARRGLGQAAMEDQIPAGCGILSKEMLTA